MFERTGVNLAAHDHKDSPAGKNQNKQLPKVLRHSFFARFQHCSVLASAQSRVVHACARRRYPEQAKRSDLWAKSNSCSDWALLSPSYTLAQRSFHRISPITSSKTRSKRKPSTAHTAPRLRMRFAMRFSRRRKISRFL